jgi:hypothetical protein
MLFSAIWFSIKTLRKLPCLLPTLFLPSPSLAFASLGLSPTSPGRWSNLHLNSSSVRGVSSEWIWYTRLLLLAKSSSGSLFTSRSGMMILIHRVFVRSSLMARKSSSFMTTLGFGSAVLVVWLSLKHALLLPGSPLLPSSKPIKVMRTRQRNPLKRLLLVAPMLSGPSPMMPRLKLTLVLRDVGTTHPSIVL